MMMVANSSIVPNKTYCQSHSEDLVCKVSTQQEFLFKIYLKDHYPDLLFIYATFPHDIKRSIPFIDTAVHHVIDIIQETLPTTTKTFWFTATATYKKKIPKGEQHHYPGYEHGWTFDEKVDACNWLLFRALKPHLKLANNSQMYGFFDLYSMSKPIQAVWATDLIHYTVHVWYRFVVEYVFAMLIAEHLDDHVFDN